MMNNTLLALLAILALGLLGGGWLLWRFWQQRQQAESTPSNSRRDCTRSCWKRNCLPCDDHCWRWIWDCSASLPLFSCATEVDNPALSGRLA
jgi:hypothetical protein